MTDYREKYFAHVLTEAINMIKEQQAAQQAAVPPPSPPPAPPQQSAVPPGSLPGDAGMPPPAGAGTDQPPVEFTLDQMVEMLNIIRGGKSFSDPEIYGQLTTLFNGLVDTDKAILQKVLQSLSGIMSQQPQPGAPPGQTAGPPQMPPAAPQATAPMPAPVASSMPGQMEEAVEEKKG